MPQSYVGKPVISKGIEELYGSLWRLPLGPASWDVSGERARSPMIQREHRISCAARIYRQPARSGGRPSLGKVRRSASWFRTATEEADGRRLAG
jgi:hypothetical protein